MEKKFMTSPDDDITPFIIGTRVFYDEERKKYTSTWGDLMEPNVIHIKERKMAYLVVDEDGDEWISKELPLRVEGKTLYDKFGNESYVPGYWTDYYEWESIIQLPWGSILKLIGKELSWKDEPKMY